MPELFQDDAIRTAALKRDGYLSLSDCAVRNATLQGAHPHHANSTRTTLFTSIDRYLCLLYARVTILWPLRHADKISMCRNPSSCVEELLQCGGKQWVDNLHLAIAAAETDGRRLSMLSKRMRGTREVVLLAVANYGAALEHASSQLQDDRNIVQVAVENDGWALKHASSRLQQDEGTYTRAG